MYLLKWPSFQLARDLQRSCSHASCFTHSALIKFGSSFFKMQMIPLKTTGLPASIQQLSVDLNSFQAPWPSTVSSRWEYNKLLSLWASSDERAATRSFTNLDSTVLVHVASSRDRQNSDRSISHPSQSMGNVDRFGVARC